jgi:hypothetical protein
MKDRDPDALGAAARIQRAIATADREYQRKREQDRAAADLERCNLLREELGMTGAMTVAPGTRSPQSSYVRVTGPNGFDGSNLPNVYSVARQELQAMGLVEDEESKRKRAAEERRTKGSKKP